MSKHLPIYSEPQNQTEDKRLDNQIEQDENLGKQIFNLITNSSKKSFLACPAYFDYVYNQGYRPSEKARNLSYGTCVHHGLEYFWKNKDDATAPEDSSSRAILSARSSGLNEYDVLEIGLLVLSYGIYWENFAKKCKVIKVEHAFDLELVNPSNGKAAKTWRRAGKIDVIIEDPFGKICVVEHKTSSEYVAENSVYRSRLDMDPQITIYLDAAREIGLNAEYCLYDVIHKPFIKPFKAKELSKVKLKKDGSPRKGEKLFDESLEDYKERLIEDIKNKPNDYFKHFQIRRSKYEMERSRYDIYTTVFMIETLKKSGYFPRNADSCHRFGKKCEYIPVCNGSVDLKNSSMYKYVTPHSELLEESSESALDKNMTNTDQDLSNTSNEEEKTESIE